MAERLVFEVAEPNGPVRLHRVTNAIVACACLLGSVAIAVAHPEGWWIGVVIPGLVGLIYVWHCGYAPVAYGLTDDAVVVHARLAKPTALPLCRVRSARHVDLDLFHVTRAGGSSSTGCAFACIGRYRNVEVGAIDASVTNTERAVLLEAVDGPSWLISPADVARFVEEATVRLSAEQ